MCKLVFRGNAPVRQPKDDFDEATLLKPGDPLDAFPDDHVFGDDEKPPLFVIVSVPDMPVAEGKLLCAPMREDETARTIGKIRSFNLPLEKALPTMSRAALLGGLVQKVPAANPAIIGAGPEVIG